MSAKQLYERWNDLGVAALAGSIDPHVRLICDPLRPDVPLEGLEGFYEWAARWEEMYEHVHLEPDALVALSDRQVLALVTISATPVGSTETRRWAAAHVWTFTGGLISGWQAHMDLDAGREMLAA